MAGFTSKESRLLMTEGGLSRLLKALPKEGKREISKAVVAWAKNARDRAKSLAPVASDTIYRGKSGKKWSTTTPGTLRENIKIGVFNRGMSAKAGIFGKGRELAFYAHFVEFGTKPHYNIKGAKAKGVRKAAAASGAKMHPGARAQPFLRPAARAAGQAGARGVVDAIRRVIAGSGGAGGQLQPIAKILNSLERNASALKAEFSGDPFSGTASEG